MTKLVALSLLALGLTSCAITTTPFPGNCEVTVVSIDGMASLLLVPSSKCVYVDINAGGEIDV